MRAKMKFKFALLLVTALAATAKGGA